MFEGVDGVGSSREVWDVRGGGGGRVWKFERGELGCLECSVGCGVWRFGGLGVRVVGGLGVGGVLGMECLKSWGIGRGGA